MYAVHTRTVARVETEERNVPSLKQLQYFLNLAARGNMTRLAEETFVSQTALSNSLARLEDELGVRLFDRVGRNLVLNEYGKTYRHHVEAAFDSLHKGDQALAGMIKHSSKSISLAMTSSGLWREPMNAFLKEHSKYTIFQRECNIDVINRMLPQVDVDFIIAGDIDFSSPHLEKTLLTEFAVRLYVPPTHRLAKRKRIKLIEAKNERFISLPAGVGFSRFCAKLFSRAGYTPDIVAECDYTLRWDLLSQGVGVVLSCDLRTSYDHGVPILITDEYAVRRMAIFWAKSRQLSTSAQDFREFLVKYHRKN